jgi:recombination protein RecR
MLSLPPALSELIHRLARFPGVGPKAAERMALALRRWDKGEVEALRAALGAVVERLTDCPRCGCLGQDGELCAVCDDFSRDSGVICVVESALDAVAIERGGAYSGLYHVLGGALSPVRGVLPEDLALAELKERIAAGGVREVIVATNASPDGEATALLLKQELEGNDGLPVGSDYGHFRRDDLSDAGALGIDHSCDHRNRDPGGVLVPPVKLTRLARGLPSGSQLDYADAETLHSALEHRTEL